MAPKHDHLHTPLDHSAPASARRRTGRSSSHHGGRADSDSPAAERSPTSFPLYPSCRPAALEAKPTARPQRRAQHRQRRPQGSANGSAPRAPCLPPPPAPHPPPPGQSRPAPPSLGGEPVSTTSLVWPSTARLLAKSVCSHGLPRSLGFGLDVCLGILGYWVAPISGGHFFAAF